MKFGAVPVADAEGAILAHRLVNTDGHTVLQKGHFITADDVQTLQSMQLETVIVAQMEATDLHENEAALRVGNAIAGENIKVHVPGVGRATLTAEVRGTLHIDVPLLNQLNNIDESIAIATMYTHSLVDEGDLVALVKILPFAVPEGRIIDVEHTVVDRAPVLSIRPLKNCSVALIISGPEQSRERLIKSFHAPVENRLKHLNSTLSDLTYVSHESGAIASAIQAKLNHDLIIVCGISAIIDQEDIVPTALRQAGGSVTHFGVPVDPGNLLMLGYVGEVPVLGAPGCIKSPKTNVIDWILPRLISGERLTRADLVSMGHGGLLEDIGNRPMPRSIEK